MTRIHYLAKSVPSHAKLRDLVAAQSLGGSQGGGVAS
jgi:hypothetical protein